MSSQKIRFRYLLGVLVHVAIALVGCTPISTAPNDQPLALAACGAEPSFASTSQLKRWQSFPVDVFVDLNALPESLRDTYREGIERGINLWHESTGGRIGAFRVSYARGAAPVEITLTDGALPERAIGITELTFTGEIIVRAAVKLTRSKFEGTPFLANDVSNTTAHEMGHVLGIVDHSPFPDDKMWIAGNFGVHNQGVDPITLLTPCDVNTLKEAYCR